MLWIPGGGGEKEGAQGGGEKEARRGGGKEARSGERKTFELECPEAWVSLDQRKMSHSHTYTHTETGAKKQRGWRQASAGLFSFGASPTRRPHRESLEGMKCVGFGA
jgi:hypothetical protein